MNFFNQTTLNKGGASSSSTTSSSSSTSEVVPKIQTVNVSLYVARSLGELKNGEDVAKFIKTVPGTAEIIGSFIKLAEGDMDTYKSFFTTSNQFIRNLLFGIMRGVFAQVNGGGLRDLESHRILHVECQLDNTAAEEVKKRTQIGGDGICCKQTINDGEVLSLLREIFTGIRSVEVCENFYERGQKWKIEQGAGGFVAAREVDAEKTITEPKSMTH